MFGGKQRKWQRRVASFFVDRIPYGKFLECIIVFYVREIDTETEQETGRALKKEHF